MLHFISSIYQKKKKTFVSFVFGWISIYLCNSAIYPFCQLMPRTAQGQAETSRDKQGQGRDKAGTSRNKLGHSLSVPACPHFSMSVHACPCLSLSVPVCPCLSLSVPVCLYVWYTFMSTPADEYTVFISMNRVTLTFLAKGTVPMHANLIYNFFFTFHLASSITLLIRAVLF